MAKNATKRSFYLALACLSLIHSPASADVKPLTNTSSCISQIQSAPQPASVQNVSRDDAKITRARSALTSLEASQHRLSGLMGRSRASEQSARYADNLGKSAIPTNCGLCRLGLR